MIMIYTTCFANLRNLPHNITPISICAKAPSWYNGLEYKNLAPSYDILIEWKSDPNEERYIRRFNDEILSKLNQDEVINDLGFLCEFNQSKHIALVCYEKSDDFCHRHLVSEWLRNNDYNVEEFKKEMK